MRILLVSSSSGSRGGGEIFLLYLAEALKAAGHTVALWASSHPRMDELAGRFQEFGEVIRTDYTNTYDHWHRGLLPVASASAAFRLAAAWFAWRPDVIHLNKQNLEDGADLLRAAAAAGTPRLCTIHITQSARFLRARFARWRDHAARRSLRTFAGPLVTVSPLREADLKAFLNSGTADIRTVANGVAPLPDCDLVRTSSRAAEGLRNGEFAIVAVGRLEAQKRPLRFLEHAARIRQVEPDVALRWIGSGRLQAEWDHEVSAWQLHGTVSRSDWRNDVRRALPAYDLFLHTAAYEGLPLAILEAMDAGLPCAVERTVHEQLPHALQACALAIDHDTDWAAVLRNRPQLQTLGQQARAIVRSEYSTQTMGRCYIAIYEELCGKR